MKIPRFLILAVLTFWGWQIGSTFLGLAIGLLLEGSVWTARRRDLADDDYRRIWDGSCLLGGIAAIYCFSMRNDENAVARALASLDWRPFDPSEQVHGAFYVSQWWPILLLPFALAAFYGSRQSHSYATFFWLLRGKPANIAAQGRIDAKSAYLALTIMSASASLPVGLSFFTGLALLGAWLLWLVRSRRSSIVIWGGLALIAVGGGLWSHKALNRLQGHVENKVANLGNQWLNKKTDERQNHTAIGRIGDLKLSGRIVLRLRAEQGPVPSLLREAAYTNYMSGRWYAGTGKNLTEVGPGADGRTWRFGGGSLPRDILRITGFLGDGIVPLPLATQRLTNLDAETVQYNRYGAVKVEGGPGFRSFRVVTSGEAAGDWPPLLTDAGISEDLQIPEVESPTIARIAEELNLHSLSFPRKLLAIQNYFSREFAYSTFQETGTADLPRGVTALSHFLTTSRHGHCEFFASATVLLLRQAGIPARYAIGYAVMEADGNDGSSYVVRERHGHAWSTCWSEADGRWIDFDTTPASGFAVDNADAPALESLTDIWTSWRYGVAAFWRRIRNGEFRIHLAFSAIALILFLARRVFTARSDRQKNANTRKTLTPAWVGPGTDSEFYPLLSRLTEAGFGPWPDEPLTHWLKRLEPSAVLDIAALRTLLALHQRYRFDPNGISPDERRQLRDTALALTPSSSQTATPPQP